MGTTLILEVSYKMGKSKQHRAGLNVKVALEAAKVGKTLAQAASE